MKIVLIGAGSQSFGRGQIADILHAEELNGRNVTLALVDEDAAALDVMTRPNRTVEAIERKSSLDS